MLVFHCSTRRSFLLALAALGTVLWAGICRADNPPPPAPILSMHKLVLKHANPSDIMRIMHWDASAAAPAPSATLPEGVKRIYALESDHSLLIQATPDGFTRVREIVKNLDFAPRLIRLKVQFVRARRVDVDALRPNSEHRSVNGPGPNQAEYLSALLQKGATVVLSRTTKTSPHDPPVSFLFQADTLNSSGKVQTVHTDLEVSAMPNQDNTITLYVMPNNLDIPEATAPQPDGPPPFRPEILRTVRSGETGAFGDLLLLGKETELLVFITPTLLPQNPDAGNESGQKHGMIQGVPKVSVAP